MLSFSSSKASSPSFAITQQAQASTAMAHATTKPSTPNQNISVSLETPPLTDNALISFEIWQRAVVRHRARTPHCSNENTGPMMGMLLRPAADFGGALAGR